MACWSDCNTSQFVRWDNVGVPSSSWFAWCGCSVPTSNGVIADASSEKSATFVTVLHAKPAVDCIKCYINNDMNDHILWNAFKTLKTVQFLITYKHACRKFGQYSRGHDIIASLWSELFLGALCHSTWLDLKASCTRHMIMKEENLQTLGRRVRAMFNHCQYRHYLRDSLRGQALRHLYPWTHCYTVLNSKVFLMYTCANIRRLAWGF